jgi:hypothetical protein
MEENEKFVKIAKIRARANKDFTIRLNIKSERPLHY